jgi:uncharacterized protein (DUF885 family)
MYRTTIARLSIVSSAALLLLACDPNEATQEAAHRSIEEVADEYIAATLERNPTMGTYYAIEGARHDRLYDNSLDALAKWEARQDVWLSELNAIGAPTEIGGRDWVTYGIMHESLESAAEARICKNELWEASTTTAWYRGLPFVFEVQPVDTEEERNQSLDRLRAVAGYIDTEISNLRLGIELGYSAPRLTVEAVPEQVSALIADDSIFLSPATRAEDEIYKAAVQKIYEEEITPAILRFAAFIKDEYLDQAREGIALSENPNGTECYPALVRSFATIRPSADEIHALGLQQIAAIRREMRSVIDEHFGGGSIEGFLRRVNSDPEFTFDSEDAVLQYSVAALDAAKAAMPRAFNRLPKADVIVKPYPEFAESGIGEYRPPSEDGTRPGIFYIAVTDPLHRSRVTQVSTLYHETYPGHHQQIAIALELGDKVHDIARYFGNSGFSEGWALYAERLADELGLFTNPIDYFGLLSEQGARASRLVIDTGLHTKGWTRQQAVDYMMSNTAWAAGDIQNDINRYISWPGQATSYMLGMLEIQRLRALAEDELGDAFDLSAFHDRVVGFGGSTLPMLHVSILAWIEEQKGNGAG